LKASEQEEIRDETPKIAKLPSKSKSKSGAVKTGAAKKSPASESETPDKPKRPKFRVTRTCVVLLLFLPLSWGILFPSQSFEDQLNEIEADHPGLTEQLKNSKTVEEFFDLLPNHRMPRAHLNRDSLFHWVYAVIASGGYLSLLWFLGFEKTAPPPKLIWTGIFTGTIGIFLLLAVQYLAVSVAAWEIPGRRIHGLILIIIFAIKLIGYSYAIIDDPDSSILGCLFGFTCGVGFCEEMCKALPLISYFLATEKPTWRGAYLIGLATSIGFGISEGVHYCGSKYNGVSSGDMYLIRFVSCVALHAVWSSGVAMLMFADTEYIDELSLATFPLFIWHYLLTAMVLHALYDTLLTKDYRFWALAVAFLSVGWWLWVVFTRHGEAKERRRQRKAMAMGTM
jgi:RsiW-degrading membrane proteinase PrsW (M82 family)